MIQHLSGPKFRSIIAILQRMPLIKMVIDSAQ